MIWPAPPPAVAGAGRLWPARRLQCTDARRLGRRRGSLLSLEPRRELVTRGVRLRERRLHRRVLLGEAFPDEALLLTLLFERLLLLGQIGSQGVEVVDDGIVDLVRLVQEPGSARRVHRTLGREHRVENPATPAPVHVRADRSLEHSHLEKIDACLRLLNLRRQVGDLRFQFLVPAFGATQLISRRVRLGLRGGHALAGGVEIRCGVRTGVRDEGQLGHHRRANEHSEEDALPGAPRRGGPRGAKPEDRHTIAGRRQLVVSRPLPCAHAEPPLEVDDVAAHRDGPRGCGWVVADARHRDVVERVARRHGALVERPRGARWPARPRCC